MKLAVFLLLFIVAAFQVFYYRESFITPDIAADEARVALAARSATDKDDILYLTHYYYPTTVYYSERQVYAVYSEGESRSWWIKPVSEWPAIVQNERVLVITTRGELESWQAAVLPAKFEILFESGGKLLLRKI